MKSASVMSVVLREITAVGGGGSSWSELNAFRGFSVNLGLQETLNASPSNDLLLY